MFEYMIQGIARAGGVEMPVGSTVLPQKAVKPRKAGIIRRSAGRLMTRVAARLNNWSSRLLEPVPQTN